MRIYRYMISAILIVLCFASPTYALSATSAIVMEQGSGRVLSEYNADEVRSIASITKLMTALVVVEQVHDLSEVVIINSESCGIEGSSMYLRTGEEISVTDLLYGLLLRSGNDAAHALAVYVAGSVDAFADLMNDKAKSLGMNSSHFSNPNGLEQEGHYSTAHDMAVLGCACLDNEILAEICGTKTITLGGRVLQNHNKLLWQYDGCIGMKTGYTERAGRTLVSAATNDDVTLVAVTLNAPDDWSDHKALLDDGFAQVHMQQLIRADEVFATIPVTGSIIPFISVCASEGLQYPMRDGEQFTKELCFNDSVIHAPIQAGACAGTIRCYCDDMLIDEIPLYYQNSIASLVVSPETIWQKIRAIVRF